MNERMSGGGNGFHGRQPAAEEWAGLLAHAVAHLAAQLTMTQVRLRAVASEMAGQGIVDQTAVQRRVQAIAQTETGNYLRENLGESLVELIDLESLQADIIDFLNSPEAP
ncbi:MAG: hypothetical protein ACJ789_21130 [Thermomicrobiales bacterium]